MNRQKSNDSLRKSHIKNQHFRRISNIVIHQVSRLENGISVTSYIGRCAGGREDKQYKHHLNIRCCLDKYTLEQCHTTNYNRIPLLKEINYLLMRITLLILVLISLLEKANAQIFVQHENDSAIIEYEDGVEWAVKQSDGYIVAAAISFINDYGKYYKVDLFIKNLNEKNVDFFPEKIKSRLYIDNRYTKDTITLKVYTNEQYLRKVKRQQNLAMALYGVSAGINAASAAYSYSTAYSYNYDGSVYITDTYTYNPAAAAIANIETTNQIISLSEMMNSDVNVKKQGYLKNNTIHSGEAVAGFVNVERYYEGNIFSIRIQVGETLFYFEWNVKDWKKLARQKRRAERYGEYETSKDDTY